MPDSVITPQTLDAPALRPGLVALRLLERRLCDRLGELDARVDVLLAEPGPYTEDEITAVDVLCASIAEVTELREAARRDVLREHAARRARRSGVRRWG
ncbi:MAG TPA: hypothetical protein VHF89_19515 [Solirubrobacteraceae bacterium]|nr:hypothetical protein [Solirubrobacteraceae bacterium]